MLFGPSSNEYTVRAPNQQANQLIGRLPNWQGRLGVGTTGGGTNLTPAQPQSPPVSGNPNLAMMVRALMANKAP